MEILRKPVVQGVVFRLPLSSEAWNNAHEELLSFMQNDTSDMALRTTA